MASHLVPFHHNALAPKAPIRGMNLDWYSYNSSESPNKYINRWWNVKRLLVRNVFACQENIIPDERKRSRLYAGPAIHVFPSCNWSQSIILNSGSISISFWRFLISISNLGTIFWRLTSTFRGSKGHGWMTRLWLRGGDSKAMCRIKDSQALMITIPCFLAWFNQVSYWTSGSGV